MQTHLRAGNSRFDAPRRQAPGPRLYWRAVVQGNRKPGDGHVETGLAWHLAGCEAPSVAASHCPEGQRLMVEQKNPDGHCLVDGTCPRCALATAAAAAERQEGGE